MKTRIDKDEMYPVYFAGDSGVEVELTKAEAATVERAWADYEAMQELLERKYNEARALG